MRHRFRVCSPFLAIGWALFATFIVGLPRPDAELSALKAEVIKAERHHADILARRDADAIGAARGLQV